MPANKFIKDKMPVNPCWYKNSNITRREYDANLERQNSVADNIKNQDDN